MSRIALLVTRPEPDATRLALHLDALGIEPVCAPMMQAHPVAAHLPDMTGFAALAATSANAIRFLAHHEPPLGLYDLPLYAVGDQTAEQAIKAGFATVHAAAGTLVDLAALISAHKPHGPIFYPAARHQSGDLAALLAPAAIAVDTCVIYEMAAATRLPAGLAERLMGQEIAGALFYSRRTAEIFSTLLQGPDFLPLRTRLACLCLSENCAAPLISRHFLRIALADYPSGEAMQSLALAFARDQIRA